MGELNGERKLFVLLVGVVVLLIAAVIGLFLRVNRLEQEVLTAVNSSLATMPFFRSGFGDWCCSSVVHFARLKRSASVAC